MALTSGKFIEPDGAPSASVQAMKSSLIGPGDIWDIGNADHNDTATHTTPINIPGTMAYIPMTNDGLGANGVIALPSGITKIWDTTTQLFDFTEFSNGDTIDVRVDLEITTTVTNQEVFVDMQFAQGGFTYTLPMIRAIVKSAGVHRALRATWFDLRDDNTRLNPAQIRVASDGAATVKVNGWNCRCFKKGRI